MPTYDYRCEKCGAFEVKQRITEDALTVCPTCGSEVHRIISKNVGIVFKGSGFYCTDHNQKSMARHINAERQHDNEALLDGDVGSYVETAEATDKKVAEL
ncbi:MAG: FmdB family zinc ribbon protein [Methylocystaceae bacterium]